MNKHWDFAWIRCGVDLGATIHGFQSILEDGECQP